MRRSVRSWTVIRAKFSRNGRRREDGERPTLPIPALADSLNDSEYLPSAHDVFEAFFSWDWLNSRCESA
jgi:hypothetical protein